MHLINLRVADSFIADANSFAEAVVYATDNQASVVQEALGSVNNTPFAQNAITYAYNNGTAVIASAADENFITTTTPVMPTTHFMFITLLQIQTVTLLKPLHF